METGAALKERCARRIVGEWADGRVGDTGSRERRRERERARERERESGSGLAAHVPCLHLGCVSVHAGVWCDCEAHNARVDFVLLALLQNDP